MNRREILKLLGMATALPSAGIKAAAASLGMETALVAGAASEALETCEAMVGGTGPQDSHWWGSTIQIAMDAQERARHEAAAGTPYPHKKSWGHGFRNACLERDLLILTTYRQKMQIDNSFREKVLATLGVLK